jgi:uncharacterized surface protein with fasciclin (FAS1) repeats
MIQLQRYRNSFLLSLSLAAVAFTGCDDDDDDTPAAQDVVAVVVNSANHTLLEAAVKKANLVNVLQTTQNITVFAPDDDAFKKVDLNMDGTPDLDTEAKINALDANGVALLTEVLTYHVLGARVPSGSVPAGPNAAVETLNEESVYATRNNNGVFINGIRVKQADINATNGVIHVTESVLMPPAGNLVEVASANPNFSYLVAAVLRADESGTSVSGALSGAGPLTVFAPTNQAFMDAGFATIEAINAADPETLRDIILYHAIPARVFSSDLTEGATPETAGGGTVTITLQGGAKVKGAGNETASNIVATNVLATNGVVHVIDRVLLP